MKKRILFMSFTMIVLLSVSSCNKTWNCQCSEKGKILQVTPIKTLGKMGAKSVCDTYQEENNRNGANMICVIK